MLLTWTAAAIAYARKGEVEWSSIAIGFFMLALAVNALKRCRRGPRT